MKHLDPCLAHTGYSITPAIMIIPGTEAGAYGRTGLFLFKIEYLRYFSIIFQIPFLFSLLQTIEQSSLCYTVDPCGYLL